MTEDRYGNRLSTDSAAAAAAYIEGVDHVLGATFGGVEAFAHAVNEDPGFALAHVGLARARMYEGDMAGAKAAIQAAEALAVSVPEREKSHIGVFALLLAGKAGPARDAVYAHVAQWPRDAMVAQVCTNVFGLIGFSGTAGREAELLAYTTALLPHYAGDWWMMSMHSLSMCETGQTAPALALMEQALQINPHNANGAHFKAHALYEAGQTAQGRGYLDDWMTAYDRRAVLHGHLRWHQALWALHDGDMASMWAAVDDGIAPGTSDSLPINTLTDTAAIYWRAEMAGQEIAPERWSALSDYAAKTFPNAGQSFADMHGALAHAMAGEGGRLAALAATTAGFAGDLVAPVARGWRAIAAQDWAGALEELTPVMADTARLGGSRAQRDLLEFTYANTLMKLGRSDEAARVIRMRRPVFEGAPPIVGMTTA